MSVKRGDLVEFTDMYIQHYTFEAAKQFGRFGVATEDQRTDRSVEVEVANGSKVLARQIHAYAWSGWMPEDLEPVYDKYHGFDPLDHPDWDDEYL